MRYNDLPPKGKEEVLELCKAQYYDCYGEHLTEHLLEKALEQENYEVTLYISFNKIDKINGAMYRIENENNDLIVNKEIQRLDNGDILIKASKFLDDEGDSISDD